MTDPLPDPLSIVTEVERQIDALDLNDESAGLVALARHYAAAIAYAGASQNALKDLGPKLNTTLVALGGRRLPAKSAPEAAPEGSAEDELAKMRQKRGRSA